MLKASGTKRLKLKHDKLVSSFAFNFNWRRYTAGMAKVLNVSSEDITVTVKDARRRLLAAITVDYVIAVTDVAAAVNMRASINVRRCTLNR